MIKIRLAIFGEPYFTMSYMHLLNLTIICIVYISLRRYNEKNIT